MSHFFFGAAAVALALCLFFQPLPVHAAARLQETKDTVVIVIDPGHGGSNLGTIENGHEEKSMTMVTAQAMYDELCLYDNVEVYLTHSADEDMSLADRAAFAAEKNADFLFSIHYNASENHELFGAELWTSVFAPYNSYGYQFGCEFLKPLAEKGLLIRGVKARINEKTGDNYYGIIREAAARDVPAVILEHCHVDEERDEGYCETDEQLREFGRSDATAAAKYFGLASSRLGVDYSGYPLADVSPDYPVPITLRDDTAPDVCQISLQDTDTQAGLLTLNVSAADYDSPLLYYSYSLDGGTTFSRRESWPDCDTLSGSYTDTFTLTLEIPDGTVPDVIVRAYNMYDLYTDSNRCQSAERFYKTAADAPSVTQTASPDLRPAQLPGTVSQEADGIPAVSDNVTPEKEVSILSFLEICLIFVCFLFCLLLISQLLSRRKRRKRASYRRNEPGDRRNQHR